MKVLSEELQQALLHVLTAWRAVDASAVDRRLFVDEHPELAEALDALDRVSSNPQPR